MLATRVHGEDGPLVLVLHGGPGAPGSAGGLARGLADGFRVLEPFQRRSGGEPLTVARHVEDLRELVESRPEERPAIVGHSWGAMLALAFAAAHPELAGPLVPVGCGTFDPVARARFEKLVGERLGLDVREELAQLARETGSAARSPTTRCPRRTGSSRFPPTRGAARRPGPTCCGSRRRASTRRRSRRSGRR
jgi:pimeloyl-ACP methyl ester carboxylesterase